MVKTEIKYCIKLPFIIFLALLSGSVSTASDQGRVPTGANSGRFSVLTYNVAGLPEGISGSHPLIYTSKISPRLNGFDIVLVQEDFSYHRALKSGARHPYLSEPGKGGSLGDGLARLSDFPFTEVNHMAWEKCYGTLGHASDCLTKKGFSAATHEIAPGVFIDIYNLHMDAGDSKGDISARTVQMDQLIADMSRRSAGKAVIVAGDWNLSGEREADLALLEKILNEENLTDSCRALSCGEERIDRILFRGNDAIKLKPVAYQVELERFANKKGRQLSDHEAVSAAFEWEYTGE